MEVYAKAGGSPALVDAMTQKLAQDRPDLVKLGRYAGQYGFVMTGGTSAKTLSVYELQAKEFTGDWAGGETLDQAAADAPSAAAVRGIEACNSPLDATGIS